MYHCVIGHEQCIHVHMYILVLNTFTLFTHKHKFISIKYITVHYTHTYMYNTYTHRYIIHFYTCTLLLIKLAIL